MSRGRREPVYGTVPITGQWALRAACRGKPTNWWYPGADVDRAAAEWAKTICARCPVRLPCLEHALRYKEIGIWGGLTESERDRMKWRGAA